MNWPLVAGLLFCACGAPRPPEYPPVTDPSGLVRRDQLVPDSGVPVEEGDTVAIHYELRLADRTLVESSRERGLPLRFQVGAGAVPRGLEQGVLGMRLFGRRRIEVPAELGYGREGRPPMIPPDARLIIDVELMEHVPPPQGD
jgi:FKBP-type peptidyl-prolyl cis-trans isomerase